MNKGELIDAMAKDAGLSKADAGKALNASISKRAARTGRNPQTGKAIKNARNTNGLPTGRRTYEPTSKTKVEYQDGTDLFIRKRPGRSQGDPVPGIGITKEQGYQDGDDLIVRKRPGRSQGDPIPGMDITIEQGYQDGDDLILRKRPGRTKYKKSKATNSINLPILTKATDYNSSRSNKSLTKH